MQPNFDHLRQQRQPTRREAALYRRWVAYLKDSRLDDDEIHRRASQFATRHEQVPTD